MGQKLPSNSEKKANKDFRPHGASHQSLQTCVFFVFLSVAVLAQVAVLERSDSLPASACPLWFLPLCHIGALFVLWWKRCASAEPRSFSHLSQLPLPPRPLATAATPMLLCSPMKIRPRRRRPPRRVERFLRIKFEEVSWREHPPVIIQSSWMTIYDMIETSMVASGSLTFRNLKPHFAQGMKLFIQEKPSGSSFDNSDMRSVKLMFVRGRQSRRGR